MKTKYYNSVWEALEDDPVKAENLRLRSSLMMAINQKLTALKDVEHLTQDSLSKLLGISQPRISALMNGKIEEFRLDMLVDLAHKLGLKVKIAIAA